MARAVESVSNPLLEILPIGREVPIGRGRVRVQGVPLSFIGKMIGRFPALRDQIADGTIGFAAVLLAVPDAIPMFLAAGVGKAGDADAEDIFGQLPMIDQLALINEIIKETMGDEKRPLVDVVKAIVVTLGLDPARFEAFMQSLRQAASQFDLEAAPPENQIAA